jgi:hypothetical protein
VEQFAPVSMTTQRLQIETLIPLMPEHACAHCDFAGAWVKDCALWDRCAAGQPREDLRKSIPKVIERWKPR